MLYIIQACVIYTAAVSQHVATSRHSSPNPFPLTLGAYDRPVHRSLGTSATTHSPLRVAKSQQSRGESEHFGDAPPSALEGEGPPFPSLSFPIPAPQVGSSVPASATFPSTFVHAQQIRKPPHRASLQIIIQAGVSPPFNLFPGLNIQLSRMEMAPIAEF